MTIKRLWQLWHVDSESIHLKEMEEERHFYCEKGKGSFLITQSMHSLCCSVSVGVILYLSLDFDFPEHCHF